MRTCRYYLAFVLLAAHFGLALQSKAQPADAGAASQAVRLPVKRVVLYKNGIGYFEHLGRVHGDQDIFIRFSSRQLDDVLKSLALLDLSGGKISGVRYDSVAPLDQQLSNIHLPLSGDATLMDLLTALRGSRVRVQSGAHAAEGRLLSVEKKTRTTKDESSEDVVLVSLVSQAGEITNFEVQPATTSVRILDPDVSQEVGRYLRLVGSANNHDQRTMTLSARGQGDRELFVSYVSEMPVWKSTYRLILPERSGQKPLLQGWAIIDNEGGEDWKDVELSLVAGAPQSFIQQISQPYYIRRPVVPMPSALQVTPQTHEGALQSSAPNNITMEMAAPPPPPGVSGGSAGGVLGGVLASSNGVGSGRGGGIGTGAGIGTGVGAGVGGSAPTNGRSFDRLSMFANLGNSMDVRSVGREAGNVFVYDIKDKVSINKNQSALVPIVQSTIDAEKVTVWNESMAYPLYALWVTNTSGNVLDGGSFHVLDGTTFAGEGIMDSIEPGEKRLLSYAVDVGVRIDGKYEARPQLIKRVRMARGILVETLERRESRAYTLRNEDSKPRTFVLEHRIRNEWKLAKNSPVPDETSKDFYRFRVILAPKESKEVTVSEFEPLQSSYRIADLNEDFFENLQRQGSMPAQLQQELRRVLDQKNAVQKIQAQIEARTKEVASIHQDQERLRENMKALKGSAEEKRLIERYTGELNQQEDRMQAIRAELLTLHKQRDDSQAKLDDTIQSMALDVEI